jgi:hypothetical protein
VFVCFCFLLLLQALELSRAQQDLLLAEKASAKLQAERDDLGKKVGPGFGDHTLRVWP